MNLQVSEVELKMAAFASSVSSVLASVACENAALRTILREQGLLTDEKWIGVQNKFLATKWKVFEAEIHAKIQEESKRAFARMSGAGETRKPS